MNINIKCQCGALKGEISGSFKSRKHRTICLCDDCQTFVRFLGKEKEILDDNGGTEIIPVYPSSLKITQGMEHLKCLRLSPKGLYRWYAGCCNTPIANNVSGRFPFVGLLRASIDLSNEQLQQSLGPVFARLYGKYGKGKLPEGTPQKVSLNLMTQMAPFLLKGFFTRKHIPHPFFESSTGAPKVKPYVLTLEERNKYRSQSL